MVRRGLNMCLLWSYIDLFRIAKKPALELSTNSENLWQDPDRKQKEALIAGHMPK